MYFVLSLHGHITGHQFAGYGITAIKIGILYCYLSRNDNQGNAYSRGLGTRSLKGGVGDLSNKVNI